MITNETTPTEALVNITMTETEKQFVEELKATYNNVIEINKKLREYKEEQNLVYKKYMHKRIITPEYYEIQTQKLYNKISELFGVTSKEVLENKNKLIELYNEIQTTSENAFALYKLYDSKKIDEQTFDDLRDTLSRKYEYIKYILDGHKYYLKPLYAEKMMKDYGITDKDFILKSEDLFKYEYFADCCLFIYMFMKRSLVDYFTRVKKHKKEIINLLARYTNKPYKAIIF